MHLLNFQVVNDFDDDLIKRHVRHSVGLGLPDVERDMGGDWATLHIYANGPTATMYPIEYPCMALNGALDLFRREGLSPTYWAACDAGEIVETFIKAPDEITTYLVASKCHPKVFERLAGSDVMLWHIDDAGAEELRGRDLMPSAISVTISAMFLAHYMGYKNIKIYGWDGCYVNGKDHAIEQPHDTSQDLTIEHDGKVYHTTNTWAAEAEDAAFMLSILPINLTIYGGQMFAHFLDQFLQHKRKAAQNG